MEINDEILNRLENISVPKEDALSYIISLYFGCVPSTTSEKVKVQVSMLGIYQIEKNAFLWNMPLFKHEIKDEGKWDWVINEYREIFKSIKSSRGGPKKSCVSRMKKFFSDNPDVRKEEIIAATKLYIGILDSKDYITSAHYFIYKGIGSNQVSKLEEWVEKYREHLKETQPSSEEDITNSMQ